MESRITQRSGVSGLTSTSYCFPFTVSEIINGLLSRKKLPHSRLIANLDLAWEKNTETCSKGTRGQGDRPLGSDPLSPCCMPLCLCVSVLLRLYLLATLKDALACCKSRSRASMADPPDPRFDAAGDFDSSLINTRPLADGARSMQIRSPDSTCAVDMRRDKGKTRYRSIARFR